MSQRESIQKPLIIPAFGGVNERVVATELPPSEFTVVEGVFPSYAGLQTRMYGKRLLAKYPDPIWGIFQFWTPVGYANGLYQFEGQVDAGPWLTPTSNIVIPALPAEIPYDGGGMTLDEFGNSYGAPVGEANVCAINFSDTGTGHEICGGPPENVGLPDDTNGGPAGQGSNCSYVNSQVTGVDPDIYIASASYANQPEIDIILPIGGPEQVPLGPDPTLGAYAPVAPPYAPYRHAARANGSYWTFSFFTGYQSHQASSASAGRFTFNFATLQGDPEVAGVSMVLTQHQGAPAIPDQTAEYPITLTRDADGAPQPVVIDLNDYLNWDFAPQSNADGFQKSCFVTLDSLVVNRRVRVCS